MKQNKPYRIILSGGGTGGHIFPAIAIANQIKEMEPSAEILFVGAIGKMEMEKVPRAGYQIVGLPVSAFHRRLTAQNLLFPFKLIASMLKAHRVIRGFHPDLVIGTGGFASGPVLRAATRMGLPSLIQEQNSFPGVTNRLLAGRVGRICVAYPGMDRYFPKDKLVLTGNPVRSDLALPAGRLDEARAFFGIESQHPVVLVFGGSQGSRTLNVSIHRHLDQIAASGIEVLWQTGTAYYPVALEAVEKAAARNVRVHAFIHEMKFAYAVASLVVCRSGAITLSELALLGKPAILVPLPSAAENHQARNAATFVDAGAALLVTDDDAPNQLASAFLSLAADVTRLGQMSEKMKPFAMPQAVTTIAAEALSLLPGKQKLNSSKSINN